MIFTRAPRSEVATVSSGTFAEETGSETGIGAEAVGTICGDVFLAIFVEDVASFCTIVAEVVVASTIDEEEEAMEYVAVEVAGGVATVSPEEIAIRIPMRSARKMPM